VALLPGHGVKGVHLKRVETTLCVVGKPSSVLIVIALFGLLTWRTIVTLLMNFEWLSVPEILAEGSNVRV
jgi:NADH:ubiquinone oxidoreductase subunit K